MVSVYSNQLLTVDLCNEMFETVSIICSEILFNSCTHIATTASMAIQYKLIKLML